ncbi:MAG: ribosomal RNA small subunit methyltransferase A [Saprospiraceae bacterium]|nr:ribosomal RNA small subunit methyltransferase A [Candidatus Brachybacter algidus]
MSKDQQYNTKKSMGQHFLNRQDIADKIVDALDYKTTQGRVMEIGPGPGILTELLIGKGAKLKCAELDFDMVAVLEKKFPKLKDQIIQGDVLRLNYNDVFEGKDFNIIGNFPYNISSQIVFQIIQYKELIPEMVGMFQKEMAERIIAPPGSSTYGVISVLTQAWYIGTRVIDVPPSAFTPPPKVNSLVIKLTRRTDDNGIHDPKAFIRVVKQSFGMRRKMLRNNLKALFIDQSLLEGEFFNKRAEQLSLEDYVNLTNLYLSQKEQ